MAGPAMLVSVSFRMAAAAAALLAITLVLACGDSEEEFARDPSVTPAISGTAPPVITLSPTAVPGTPVPVPSDSVFTDASTRYSVNYPGSWKPRLIPEGGIPDFDSAVEFTDSEDTLRSSVYLFTNPKGLSVREWVASHDSIFADAKPEERQISGLPALVAPLNFEGMPSPQAYLAMGSYIVGLKGLTTEDFDILASGFRQVGSE